MRIHHQTHGWAPDHTDPEWAKRVERESEAHTRRRQLAYEKAARRLARAEAKAQKAEREKASARRLEKLRALVAERRQELLDLEQLANKSPAGSSNNRGQGSHRGIPVNRRCF